MRCRRRRIREAVLQVLAAFARAENVNRRETPLRQSKRNIMIVLCMKGGRKEGGPKTTDRPEQLVKAVRVQ